MRHGHVDTLSTFPGQGVPAPTPFCTCRRRPQRGTVREVTLSSAATGMHPK